MFWKKKPTELEQATADAVAIAAEAFDTGPLYGSQTGGWANAEDHADITLAYWPRSYSAHLVVHGAQFELTKAQSERLDAVIARRVLRAYREAHPDIAKAAGDK